MKNSFKALRAKLRFTENKLNNSLVVIEMQNETIDRLENESKLKNARIKSLEKSILIEEKARKRLKLRLVSSSQLKNNIYDNYMKDVEKLNKKIFNYRILCLSMLFVINALTVGYFIKG